MTTLSALEEAHAECVRITNRPNTTVTVRELLRAVDNTVTRAERALGFRPGPAGVVNWAGRLGRAHATMGRARARIVDAARAHGWSPRAVAWAKGRGAALEAADAAAEAGERLWRLTSRANGGALPPDPR